MTPPSPPALGHALTGRQLALKTLLAAAAARKFAPEVLDRGLHESPLPAGERKLATALVYGVLRRRASLDALVTPFVTRPAHRVEAWLWEALRVGAYQLALMDGVPAHAALNETVELAVYAGRPGAKGFVNAVLRRVADLVSAERCDGPAADALPLDAGGYRRLRQPVLPDPAAAAAEHLAAAFSLPEWLTADWLERYQWTEAVRLAAHFAGPAPVWLRVNRLVTDRVTLLDRFRTVNVAAEPGEHPQSVKLLDHLPIRELPGYDEGAFAVQDVSSMAVGTAVNPKPGSAVLDLCAAPGGKTTHLAELMLNRGRVVACDIDDARLKTLADLCQRLGAKIVETAKLSSPTGEDVPAGPFDAALVDVPCSNTGVLGRRPEVRWRLKPSEFQHLIRLQTRLLIQACERVRPGGVAVYSTCSIDPRENQGVVRAVLRGLPAFKLEAEEERVPGRPGDGGYWARLRLPGGQPARA